jgi:uroporphyrinogen-III decarboxylase
MTVRERMLSAIKREPVDRIPAATYNFHPLGNFSTEPGYAPMLEALRESENVGIVCKVDAVRRGGRGELFSQTHKIEGDNTFTITQVKCPKGELRTVHKKPGNQPGYTVEPLIKDDRDVERFLSLPDDPALIDMSPVKDTSEKLGDKGLAYVSYADPFYAVAHLFDFEDFAVRCVTQCSQIRELVGREFERIKRELTEMVHKIDGSDALFYTAGPEIATPPLFSQDVFKQFVTPYQKELVGIIKEAGQLCSVHCHVKVGSVFEEFIEIGADVLEPLEPPPQGDIHLKEALGMSEGRICLMGYLQDQDLYTLSTDEIKKKVEEICRLVDVRTGYIMSSTATPFMFPPPKQFVENYIQFIRSANFY